MTSVFTFPATAINTNGSVSGNSYVIPPTVIQDTRDKAVIETTVFNQKKVDDVQFLRLFKNAVDVGITGTDGRINWDRETQKILSKFVYAGLLDYYKRPDLELKCQLSYSQSGEPPVGLNFSNVYLTVDGKQFVFDMKTTVFELLDAGYYIPLHTIHPNQHRNVHETIAKKLDCEITLHEKRHYLTKDDFVSKTIRGSLKMFGDQI